MSSAREENIAEQPTILNLVLLGTGYHRLQAEERHLLTDLADAIDIGPNQSVHLIDGLGGHPDSKHQKSKLHPMVGTYNFKCHYDASTGAITTTKKLKSTFFGASTAGGQLKGSGYREAIDEAVNVIEAMIAAGKKPLIINMYGFSRGGDTALRICNVLHSHYKREEVKVNIFAIDPVPGAGRRKAKKAQFIPNNVEEYYSILMQDENRPGFEPQDKRRLKVQDPSVTTVRYQSYAGNHGTGLRMHSDPNKDQVSSYETATLDTTRLVWDDLHKFAWRHASMITHIPYLHKVVQNNQMTWAQYDFSPLSNEERLQAYSQMASNRNFFAAGRAVPNLTNLREHVKYKYDYILHGEKYFHDAEHQELFYRTYPHFFDYYFQNNQGHAKPENVLKDVVKIQSDLIILGSLAAAEFNLMEITGVQELGPPSGIHLTINDLKGPLANLWEKVLLIANPVLTGQDDSISTAVAERLVKFVHQTLISKMSVDDKIMAISVGISDTLQITKKESIFMHKLANLLAPETHDETENLYSRRLGALLGKFLGGLKLFDKKPMEKDQQHIIKQLISLLDHIEILGLGNDRETLGRITNIALMQSRSILNNYKVTSETPLDKFLRKSLLEITGYPVIQKNEVARVELDRLIQKFERDINLALSPAADTNKSKSPAGSESEAGSSGSENSESKSSRIIRPNHR